MRRSLIFILLFVGPSLGTKITSRNTKATVTEEHARRAVSKLNINETENIANASKYAPQFRFPSKMLFLDTKHAGSNMRFKCEARGNPVPNITWYKNNELGIQRPYLNTIYRNWYMELKELTKSDTGNYTCKVCNELGCIQHTTFLRVQGQYLLKPYIKEGYPGNKTVFENEMVKFECPPVSDLKPFIAWTWLPFNDTEKQELGFNFAGKPEELNLTNVTSADEGWYECSVINTLGSSESRGYLTVKKKQRKEGEDTTIIDPKSLVLSVSYTTITVISTSIFAVVLLAVAIIIATIRKLKKEKTKKQQAIETTTAVMTELWTKVVKVKHNSEDDNLILPIVTIEKVRYTELTDEVNASRYLEYVLPIDTKWEVLKKNLILGSVLGEGEFGKVVKAEYLGTASSRMPSTVAVKMLKANHSEEDMKALVSELEIMKKIGQHENVVNLLGCCTQDGPIYVIVEYANNGCLKDYLKKHQPNKVWSFGVLAWEIMTFGSTPYRNISHHVLYQYLKSGQRLEKPEGCCQEIYALMLRCWNFNPTDRPQFSELVINLLEILNV